MIMSLLHSLYKCEYELYYGNDDMVIQCVIIRLVTLIIDYVLQLVQPLPLLLRTVYSIHSIRHL